jgi:hypothetical protein
MVPICTRSGLAAQQPGPVEAEPDGAPAERRILLLDIAHIGQHLVAADIESAEGHRPLARGIEHGAVKPELLVGARQRVSDHELQLGAEQADAAGAGLVEMWQVDGEAGIDHQREFVAVLGHTRPVAQRVVLRLAPRPQLHPLAIGAFNVGRRAHVHLTGGGVDDNGVALLDQAGGVGDLADRRNAERARHDRDVRGRSAFLQHQPAQPFAVIVEQRRRAHRACDQDRVFR